MGKKISALFVVLIVLASFSFSSCNRDNDVIVIWAWGSYITAAHEAIAIYRRDVNPDARFEVLELGQYELVQKLNIALASGSMRNLPDIVIEEDYNLKGYIRYFPGKFADLTNYLNPTDFMNFKIANVTYNGRVYGIPYSSGAAAMFFRLDILEQAGFQASDMDGITWERFIEIGQQVKEITGTFMLPISPEGNIEGRIMLQSAGLWYYDEEYNLNILDNIGIEYMMTTIKALFESGIVLRIHSWDDIIAAFYNGLVASVAGGPWWAPIIAENQEQAGLWRVARIPRMSGDPSFTNYSNIAGCSWMVLNRGNQDRAINFLMKTVGTSTELADIMVERGRIVPVLRTAVSVPNAVAGDPFFGGQNFIELMANWGENIPAVNYGHHTYEIAYAHGWLMPDFLRGERTLHETINLLQAEAQTIIGR